MAQELAIGVDGCADGWMAVFLSGNLDVEARVFPSVDELWNWAAPSSLILIDIPIGLRDCGSQPRSCEPMARRLLGSPRASSVFTPPVRPVLQAGTWEEAAALNYRLTGRRISRQAWNLVPKIREVDEFLRGERLARGKLRETHPELLFRAFNRGRAIESSKKSHAGRQERLRVLERVCPKLGGTWAPNRFSFGFKAAFSDDFIDALAAAVACRLGSDRLRSIPEKAEFDSAGLRMEMMLPAADET